MQPYYHRSVMAEQVLEYLAPDSAGQLMIDGTLGEGGHSAAFLERFPDLTLVGLETDPNILSRAEGRLASFGDRVRLENTWFDDFLRSCPLAVRPDRILLDLGISVFHYQASDRGFSFRADEPLDMRLRPGQGESARDVVMLTPEKELADLIFRYGEERYSRRIARSLVERRKTESFATAAELAEAVFQAVPVAYRHGRIHPATKTFQALRIVVNDELNRLERALEGGVRCLQMGGRMGIITFHSLEDRMVKRFFRDLARSSIPAPESLKGAIEVQPVLRLVNKKPILADEKEVQENPPSRSAKLRVVEKIAEMPRSA
ncbi:16S rRNA (cytosine(1402)-N(4))-methyltransferase RsmH [Spirochaeta africana]|uniref:Ribosomal RNA small subunit methyltransferase H n=1 Tax=Spirochaeta africana (strain ATCC 700263 / DSM 8902 / Z-7692) TaxID=889378 RepID=H9UKX8_SPIAZ|nr:16S rRNA (cytosine(1402)-N(4))-methyltransferase RsmH [Spirochaeta africana]AFG38171.1 S-adenosyl-methyltransferase MraW [Spirochaeta africana DSM 8902]